MEQPPPKSLSSIEALEKRLYQMKNSVEAITPPRDLLDSELRLLSMIVDRDIYLAYNSPPSDRQDQDIPSRIAALGFNWGVEDTRLKSQYRESAEEKNLEYEKSLNLDLASCCFDMIELIGGVIGPSQVVAHVERFFSRSSSQASVDSGQTEQPQRTLEKSPTPETAQNKKSREPPAQGQSETERETSGRTTAAATAVQEKTASENAARTTATPFTTVTRAKSTEASAQKPLSNESASPATGEILCHPPETHTEQVASTAGAVPELTVSVRPPPTTGKRQAGANSGEGSSAKRPRTEQTEKQGAEAGPGPRRRKEKSTTFEEVYGDGNADRKYIIAQVNNKFYVFRCEECNKFFSINPIQGAARHLSKVHNLSARHSVAIRVLGVRVRNCTGALMEKNNSVATRHFRPEIRPQQAPSAVKKTSQNASGASAGARGGTASASGRSQRHTSGIAYPSAGCVYQVYWSNSKTYGVLMLRMGDFTGLGIPGSVEDVHLAAPYRLDLPPCYSHDTVAGTFAWSEGYEDDGPLVMKRQFPVMFFEGPKFPEDGRPGFAFAEHLETWEYSDPSVQFRDTVSKVALLRDLLAPAGDIIPVSTGASRASGRVASLANSPACDFAPANWDLQADMDMEAGLEGSPGLDFFANSPHFIPPDYDPEAAMGEEDIQPVNHYAEAVLEHTAPTDDPATNSPAAPEPTHDPSMQELAADAIGRLETSAAGRSTPVVPGVVSTEQTESSTFASVDGLVGAEDGPVSAEIAMKRPRVCPPPKESSQTTTEPVREPLQDDQKQTKSTYTPQQIPQDKRQASSYGSHAMPAGASTSPVPPAATASAASRNESTTASSFLQHVLVAEPSALSRAAVRLCSDLDAHPWTLSASPRGEGKQPGDLGPDSSSVPTTTAPRAAPAPVSSSNRFGPQQHHSHRTGAAGPTPPTQSPNPATSSVATAIEEIHQARQRAYEKVASSSGSVIYAESTSK